MPKKAAPPKRMRAAKKPPETKAPNILELLAGSGSVWRNRLPAKRERGNPVKPGTARFFVHTF